MLSLTQCQFRIVEVYILVKVSCECVTGNIARRHGREPIKHEAQPCFLASSTLNDLKWALRSKLPHNGALKEPWQDQ